MKEKIIEKILMILAFSAIGLLLLITVFIFREGLPVILKAGLPDFLFSAKWSAHQGPFRDPVHDHLLPGGHF